MHTCAFCLIRNKLKVYIQTINNYHVPIYSMPGRNMMYNLFLTNANALPIWYMKILNKGLKKSQCVYT